jgi:hypothetical protein
MNNKDDKFIFKFQKTYGIMNVENHLIRCEDNMKMEDVPTCIIYSHFVDLRWWHMKHLHQACV